MQTKNMRMVYLVIALVVVIGIIALWLWWDARSIDEPAPHSNTATAVEIQDDFGSKLVYARDQEATVDELRNHCQAQGGMFNECGSQCAPDAEVCILICAYTCEFGSGQPNEVETETYTNQNLGISIEVPNDFEIRTTETGVVLVKLGPTQTDGTEIFDGVSISLSKASYTGDLIAYVNEQVTVLENVTSGPTAITFQGRPAYVIQAQTLGDYTYMYVAVDSATVMTIAYLAPDPNDLGFEGTVQMIVQSISFLADSE